MLKPLLLAAACAAVLSSCATSSMTEPTSAMTAAYAAAVADTRRPAEEVARDPLRHPMEMLAFAQVQAGDVLARVAGYITRVVNQNRKLVATIAKITAIVLGVAMVAGGYYVLTRQK